MAAYKKLDMVLEADSDDPPASIVKGNNKVSTEAADIKKKTSTFRELKRDHQISSEFAKYGDGLVANGVGKEERAFVIKQNPNMVTRDWLPW
jgi:hypothetical protein